MINTGTTPAIPDLPGITESRPWTSETILKLERLPSRLLILGGRYVGCEFASMYALFGSQVIMLQGRSQLPSPSHLSPADCAISKCATPYSPIPPWERGSICSSMRSTTNGARPDVPLLAARNGAALD